MRILRSLLAAFLFLGSLIGFIEYWQLRKASDEFHVLVDGTFALQKEIGQIEVAGTRILAGVSDVGVVANAYRGQQRLDILADEGEEVAQGIEDIHQGLKQIQVLIADFLPKDQERFLGIETATLHLIKHSRVLHAVFLDGRSLAEIGVAKMRLEEAEERFEVVLQDI